MCSSDLVAVVGEVRKVQVGEELLLVIGQGRPLGRLVARAQRIGQSTRAYSRGNAKLLECIVPFTTCPFTFSEETIQYSIGPPIVQCL